jgi:hypothetical protein
MACLHDEMARIGPEHPGENANQRRLAGTILAEDGVDLAGMKIEADVSKRHRLAKRFSDANDPRAYRRLGAPVVGARGSRASVQ